VRKEHIYIYIENNQGDITLKPTPHLNFGVTKFNKENFANVCCNVGKENAKFFHIQKEIENKNFLSKKYSFLHQITSVVGKYCTFLTILKVRSDINFDRLKKFMKLILKNKILHEIEFESDFIKKSLFYKNFLSTTSQYCLALPTDIYNDYRKATPPGYFKNILMSQYYDIFDWLSKYIKEKDFEIIDTSIISHLNAILMEEAMEEAMENLNKDVYDIILQPVGSLDSYCIYLLECKYPTLNSAAYYKLQKRKEKWYSKNVERRSENLRYFWEIREFFKKLLKEEIPSVITNIFNTNKKNNQLFFERIKTLGRYSYLVQHVEELMIPKSLLCNDGTYIYVYLSHNISTYFLTYGITKFNKEKVHAKLYPSIFYQDVRLHSFVESNINVTYQIIDYTKEDIAFLKIVKVKDESFFQDLLDNYAKHHNKFKKTCEKERYSYFGCPCESLCEYSLALEDVSEYFDFLDDEEENDKKYEMPLSDEIKKEVDDFWNFLAPFIKQKKCEVLNDNEIKQTNKFVNSLLEHERLDTDLRDGMMFCED